MGIYTKVLKSRSQKISALSSSLLQKGQLAWYLIFRELHSKILYVTTKFSNSWYLFSRSSPKKRDKSYKVTWKTKKVAHSVVSDSLWPHGRYSPWNSPGQNTGVGTLSLLQSSQPRDGTQVSRNAGGFFTSWATMEAPWVTESLWWRQQTAQVLPSPGHASLPSGGWNPGTFGWLNSLPSTSLIRASIYF